jgi:hypothetical protein
MSQFDELEEALTLVEALSTSEQIKELLRKRKGEPNVRLSAESKADLVHHNLKEAVTAKAISINDVFDLIRLAEENGDQHIFYYRVTSKAVAEVLNYQSVARQLWGATWEKQVAKFPSIRLRPNNYTYGDFRALTKKPRDWILKVYGQNTITRFTGKTEERGNSIWREFVDEPLRVVLLARWNSPDILEIRVQRNESKKRVEEWKQKIWDMLSPAVAPVQFKEWVLTSQMQRIILEHSKNHKIYTFRDASIEDMGVNATFQAGSDEGDLFASQRSIEAIEGYIKSESDCRGLTVTWLASENGREPIQQIRTLLAAKAPNEMIVPGHCYPEDIDYVTDQLRKFGKAVS